MTDLALTVKQLGIAAEIHEPIPNPRTEVVFIGVWNAGKSTLLKRLLLETGNPVPSWLTVSAVRETNFVGEVIVDDHLVLVDTPGVGAGISLHEGEVASGLRRADVVVVLLLPALLTAEDNDVVRILRGEHVHAQGWPMGRDGLRVLVTQLDQGGLNPVADADAFLDYAKRKVEELEGILRERAVELPVGPAVVVADLNAEVSDDRENLELDDYVRGDWDGIGSFLSFLRDLPHENVRALGAARRLAQDAAVAAEARRRAAAAAEQRIDILEVEVATIEAQRREALAQVVEARADLEQVLDDFAASVYGGDLHGDHDTLQRRYREVIDGWLDRYRDRVDDLDVDVGLDPNGIGADRTSAWAYVDAVLTDARFGAKVKDVIGQVFDTPFDELREELARTRDPEYWKGAARKFRTERQAKVASGILLAGAGIDLLLETRSLLGDMREDPTPEHERRASELRKKVRDANAAAVDQAVPALQAYVNAVIDPLEKEVAAKRQLVERGRRGAAAERAAAQEMEDAIDALRAAVSGG